MISTCGDHSLIMVYHLYSKVALFVKVINIRYKKCHIGHNTVPFILKKSLKIWANLNITVWRQCVYQQYIVNSCHSNHVVYCTFELTLQRTILDQCRMNVELISLCRVLIELRKYSSFTCLSLEGTMVATKFLSHEHTD